jgi:subtilisin family serine protease
LGFGVFVSLLFLLVMAGPSLPRWGTSSGKALAGGQDPTLTLPKPPLGMPEDLLGTIQVLQEQSARLVRTESAARHFAQLSTEAQSKGTIPVMVRLRAAFAPEREQQGGLQAQAQQFVIAQVREQVIEELSGYDPASLKAFAYIPYIAVRVNATGVASLQRSTGVLDVEQDLTVVPDLAESVALIGATRAWENGYTGAGQTIAILDSGVDRNHPFLAGKVVSEACYSTNASADSYLSLCPSGSSSSTVLNSGLPCTIENAGCAHGTHVAGIAAGKGTAFSGVARDANLIAIQVFTQHNSPGSCNNGQPSCIVAFTSDLIRALERVYTLRTTFQIAAVNMSLGGLRYFTNCNGDEVATKAAIDLLRQAGIASIAASGNGGYTDSTTAPACISTAISVGATRDYPTQLDQVSSFSNSAPFLHLLAPGEGITSSVLNGEYATWAGTSMAAPHVAGAWAIARQKAPSASVGEILDAFIRTGLMITDGRNGVTTPRIRVDEAVRALGAGDPPPPPPLGPGLLAATVTGPTQVNLTWRDNATNEEGFRVQRRERGAEAWTIIASVGTNNSSYQDSGLRAGATYEYRVFAFNAGGESPFSNIAQVSMPEAPPVAPTSLAAVVISSTQINLSWTDNSINETGFKIFRRTGTTGNWTIIATPGQNTTLFQNTGLTPGTTYSYTVLAYNPTGDSAGSNEVTVTTPAVPLPGPTNLQASVLSANQVTLTWIDNATTETGFRLLRRSSPNSLWTTVATLGQNVTSYLDLTVTPGSSFLYTVLAFNETTESGLSNEILVTTPGVALPPPTNLSAIATSPSQINLRWTDNSQTEAGFRIRRRTGLTGGWAEIAVVPANQTTFENTQLSAGQAYSYTISAFDATIESAFSNEATATTFPERVSDDRPAPPARLQATANSTTSVELNWVDRSTNEVGFLVFRRPGIDGFWEPVQDLGPNQTRYEDVNLTPGTNYYYLVRSYNLAGNSVESNEVSVQTPKEFFVPLLSGVSMEAILNRNRQLLYRIQVPIGATQMQVQTTGTGNVDLYVRYGDQPQMSTFNCRSTSNTSSEFCLFSFPAAGDWHIMVYGVSAALNQFTLTARIGVGFLENLPAGPSDLVATEAGTNQIRLKWTDNSINEGAFRIRRKIGKDGLWVELGATAPNITTIVDAGLQRGVPHYYVVTAFNTAGLSAASNEAMINLNNDVPQRPETPGSLVATAISATQIRLQWREAGGEENGFRIRRRTGESGSWAVAGEVGPNITSFEDRGLSPNTSYSYSVSAFNFSGESPSTNTVTVTTPRESVPLPAGPINLQARSISPVEVDLTWTDQSINEMGFRIQRRLASGGLWTQIGEVERNTTNFRSSGLVPGESYSFRVFAFNGTGESPPSNEAQATVPVPETAPPAAPTDLVASSLSSIQIQLQWRDASTNETGFRIERRIIPSGGSAGTTEWQLLTTVGANLGLHLDQQVVGGATYLYRIVAFNIYGESLASNEARATVPSVSVTPLLNGQMTSRSVNRMRPAFFSVEVPVGSNQLSVQLSGGANVDLYVRAGELPQIDQFDCRSNNLNSAELCVIPFPTPGIWYILVVGNSTTVNNFSITATHRGGISLTRTQVSAAEPWQAILPVGRKQLFPPSERPRVRRDPMPWN